MSRLSRRASAALLVLLLLSSPAFAAPARPAAPRLGEQLSELVVRAWHALASLLPSEKRGPGMDPIGLDVDPGTPPQATPSGDGEQGPGMDPWG
jgi:hypothetical protein